MRPQLLVAALALLSACGETDECRELTKLRALYERSYHITRGSAAKAGPLEKRAEDSEARARQLLATLGVDDPDAAIEARLRTRTASLAGSAVSLRKESRTTVADPNEPPATVVEFRFRERDLARALAKAETLAATPPLLLFRAMVRKSGTDEWTVELERSVVDRVPIDPKPVALPSLPSFEAVKSQLGFCGADKLREDLRHFRAGIAEAEPDALRTSVLLPKLASYNGLRRRAELQREIETETRRLAHDLLVAAQRAKVDVRGLFWEEPTVVIEIAGAKPERERLERQLVAVASALKTLESKAGSVRLGLPNEAARKTLHGAEAEGEMPGVLTTTAARGRAHPTR